jgi:hypothetical protein
MQDEFKEFSQWRIQLIATGVVLAIEEVGLFGIIILAEREHIRLPVLLTVVTALVATIPWRSAWDGYRRIKAMALRDEMSQEAVAEVWRIVGPALACAYVVVLLCEIQLANVLRPL